MKKYKAARYKKYPAAVHAVCGYLVIERLPDRLKPAKPQIMWPDYEAVRDADHYSHFDDGPTKPARPTPYEIDHAFEWIQPCKWMWQPGRDRRDWEMFVAYAHGVSVLNIADHHKMSRQYASNLLDSIFYQIQVESELNAMRLHCA